MPEADRVHDRPVELARSLRSPRGSAARPRRGRRRGSRASPASTTAPRRERCRRRLGGRSRASTSRRRRASSRSPSDGGLLGVERKRQRHDSTSSWRWKISSAASQVVVAVLRRRRRGSRGARGRSAPAPGCARRPRRAQAKASSSQRLPSTTVPRSQCGQPTPPAIISAVSASSLATAQSSAARRLSCSWSIAVSHARCGRRERGGALRAQLRRSARPSRRGLRTASPRSVSFSGRTARASAAG